MTLIHSVNFIIAKLSNIIENRIQALADAAFARRQAVVEYKTDRKRKETETPRVGCTRGQSSVSRGQGGKSSLSFTVHR